jgi:hypothetical protein
MFSTMLVQAGEGSQLAVQAGFLVENLVPGCKSFHATRCTLAQAWQLDVRFDISQTRQ